MFRFHVSCEFQAGLQDKWMEEVLEEAKRDSRREMKSEGDTQDEDTILEADTDPRQPLSLNHLQGAFWLFFLGLLAVLFSFLNENGTEQIKTVLSRGILRYTRVVKQGFISILY